MIENPPQDVLHTRRKRRSTSSLAQKLVEVAQKSGHSKTGQVPIDLRIETLVPNTPGDTHQSDGERAEFAANSTFKVAFFSHNTLIFDFHFLP